MRLTQILCIVAIFFASNVGQGPEQANQNNEQISSLCESSTTFDEACIITDFSETDVCKDDTIKNWIKIRFPHRIAVGISAKNVTLINYDHAIIEELTKVDSNIQKRWDPWYHHDISNANFGVLEFGINISKVYCEDQIMIHLEVTSGNVTYKTEPKTWFTVQGCGDDSGTTASVSCPKQSPEGTTLTPGTGNPTDDGQGTNMPTSPKPTFTEKPASTEKSRQDVPTSTKSLTTETEPTDRPDLASKTGPINPTQEPKPTVQAACNADRVIDYRLHIWLATLVNIIFMKWSVIYSCLKKIKDRLTSWWQSTLQLFWHRSGSGTQSSALPFRYTQSSGDSGQDDGARPSAQFSASGGQAQVHLDGDIQGDSRNGGARSSAPPTASTGQAQAPQNADVHGDGRSGVRSSAPSSASKGQAQVHQEGDIRGDGMNGGAKTSAQPTASAGQAKDQHGDIQGDMRNDGARLSSPSSASRGQAQARQDGDVRRDKKKGARVSTLPSASAGLAKDQHGNIQEDVNDGARPSAPSSLSRGQAQGRHDGDVHGDERKRARVSTPPSASTAQAKDQHGDIREDMIDGARPLVPSFAPRGQGQGQDHNWDNGGDGKNDGVRPSAPPTATGEQAQHQDGDIQGARRKENREDHSTKSEEEYKASPGALDVEDGDIHGKGRENYQEGCSNSEAVVKPLKKVSTSSSLLDDSNDDPELVIGVDEHYDDKGEIFEANDSGCDSVNEKLLRKDGKVEKQHKRESSLVQEDSTCLISQSHE